MTHLLSWFLWHCVGFHHSFHSGRIGRFGMIHPPRSMKTEFWMRTRTRNWGKTRSYTIQQPLKNAHTTIQKKFDCDLDVSASNYPIFRDVAGTKPATDVIKVGQLICTPNSGLIHCKSIFSRSRLQKHYLSINLAGHHGNSGYHKLSQNLSQN